MSYLDTSIPRIAVPRFTGTRYDAHVPDTLDLAQMAELTVRGITNCIDPARDYKMFTRAYWNRRPPVGAFLAANDGASGAKQLEGLPLLRIICGSTFNADVDRGYMQTYLDATGTDGVVYWTSAWYPNPNTIPPVFSGPHASVENEGRLILAMCMWYQHDGNPLWRTLIEKKITRLSELAIPEDDYVYFSNRPYEIPMRRQCDGECCFTPDDTKATVRIGGRDRLEDVNSPIRGYGAHIQVCMLGRSLCVYYRLTGYAPALNLAGKLIRGLLGQKPYTQDGGWLCYHFHANTATLLALAEYGAIVEDKELLELVRKCFEYGQTVSDPLVGWFPEYVPGTPEYTKIIPTSIGPATRTCETCEVADMVGLALKLTQAGVGDYWEEAERWTRNQFAENQLTPEKFEVLQSKVINEGLFEAKPVSSWETSDVARCIGTFAGIAAANDWGTVAVPGCCTGNASRTIYWIWDSIVTRKPDEVRVNLLLNRASPWVDVDSYLPYEGKVVLRAKQATRAAVRIPAWAGRDTVVCSVGDRTRVCSWNGSYLGLGALRAGDTAVVTFPVPTYTTPARAIGDLSCTLTVKGNTVVEISPRGEGCPLYERERFKQDKAPMRKTTRFVAEESVLW
jgi:hypothetical protein